MRPHDHFEELCTLALSGEIADKDCIELREHLLSCAQCRKAAIDFHQIGIALSITAAEQERLPIPDDMTARFIARFRSSGVPLAALPAKNRTARSRWKSYRAFSKAWILGTAAAIILFLLAFSVGVRYGYKRGQAISGPASLPDAPGRVAPVTPQNDSLSLQDQLIGANQELARLRDKLGKEEFTLASLKSQRDQLDEQVAEFKAKALKQGEEQSALNREIAKLAAELERVQAAERAEKATILADEAELRGERLKTADLESELSAARELNGDLRQARDLITARNLHLKDIPPEVDEGGERKGAFGRVFYAEGKRLDFYAYDLTTGQPSSADVSFYVWRATGGKKSEPTVLGKLQIDNEKDRRWALHITDPHLIANLDTVFVTREPNKAVATRPTGKQLLFAFLSNKANHP